MTKLIEKLGLPELPEEIVKKGDVLMLAKALGLYLLRTSITNAKVLLYREQQRRAMLEALIDQCRFLESMGFISVHNESVHPIKLIESTIGKTWAEIKGLLEVE